MKYVLYFFAAAILCGCNGKTNAKKDTSENFTQNFDKIVLAEKQKGIEYYAKINRREGIFEYAVIYVGSIISNKKTLNILYTTTYSGYNADALHANSKFILYSSENERLGYYYVGGNYYTPSVNGSDLVIKESGCSEITTINFNDSIPKEIFIHCHEDKGKTTGDIYTFTPEE